MLQEKMSEQLVLIASLQMRLDEQRMRADNVSKQTNTSLEIRIYDLENELQNLTEKIANRDKTIKQLNNAIDETRKRLEEREMELLAMNNERNLIDLENQVDNLKEENRLLNEKINVNVQNAQLLPNLVDNILADKNADIEKLRVELNETKKQLEFYSSLNFDQEQLRTLSQLTSSERAFADILTLIETNEMEKVRKDVPQDVTNISSFHFKRSLNEITPLKGLSEEISTIERLHSPELNYTTNLPLSKPNSTEIKSADKKTVRFDEPGEEVSALKKELNAKNELIVEYDNRLKLLEELEVKYDELRGNLESTENALKAATDTFVKEQNQMKEIEQNLRVELAEKKMHLTETQKKLDVEKEDTARKEQMYLDLSKEKRELEKQLKQITERNQQSEEMKVNHSEEVESLRAL